MIGKRKQNKTSKVQQHQVPPTASIVVSALLNSVYNAETDCQIFAAIDAMTAALNKLSSYDLQATNLFVSELYQVMMKYEYTRFGIERTSEEFVKLGLEIPEE